MADADGAFRIGEVSKRTGVAVTTLRAWERRYELLEPTRTDGGHRLYREVDVMRVRAMQSLIDDGWSAAAAAREVKETAPDEILTPSRNGRPDVTASERLQDQLQGAFESFEPSEIDAALDGVFARLDVPAALEEVILPVVRWVGEGWRDDPRCIAREHVASNAVRPRLARLLRMVPLMRGAPACVVAAPEHEEHDLGLLSAAAIAAGAGWRVHYVGPRTPNDALEDLVEGVQPRVVMIGCSHRAPAEEFLADPPDLGDVPLLLGGAGFAAGDEQRLDRATVFTGPLPELPHALEALLG